MSEERRSLRISGTPGPDGRPAARGRTPDEAQGADGTQGSGEEPRPPRTVWQRVRPWLLWSALGLFVLLLAGVITVAVLVDRYADQLPSVDDLGRNYRPPQVTRIYARDGTTVIGEIFADEGRRTIVPIGRIPRVLVDAVIAAEDADFRSHAGLDWLGMVRSLIINVWKGYYAQGGSTITQQVVRTFYLGREKTLERKIKELLLARRVEQHLSKEQILSLYLNQICFGHGRYGVEEASRYYFGKPVAEVNLAEAALLAALPKGPAIYSPRVNPQKAIERRHYVLRQMARHGYVTAQQMATADAEPIRLAPEPTGTPAWAAGYVEAVRAELRARLGDLDLAKGGYTVIAALDPRLQQAAQRAAVAGLRAVDERHGYVGPLRRLPEGQAPAPGALRLADDQTPQAGRVYLGRVTAVDDRAGTVRFRVGRALGDVRLAEFARYNPEGLPPSRFAQLGAPARVSFVRPPEGDAVGELQLVLGPEAAVVLVDPATGEVAALVGGSSPGPGRFDRARQARRQPGSSFKPLVYLAALESRTFTAASIVNDAPVVYGNWKPQNSGRNRFLGPISLRTALARSVNVVAVKVLEQVGVDNVLDLARRLGIASTLRRELTLALGASEVTPMELTGALAVVAAGGVRREPTFVREVRRPDGTRLSLDRPAERQVVDAGAAHVLADMLRSVIEEPAATGHAAAGELGRPAAGKTGTSTAARDAWFVGFTPQWVAGVWVGFDDNHPLGAEGPEDGNERRPRTQESGGRTALPIWLELMKAAHAGLPIRPFARPAGVTTALVDPATGLLAAGDTPGAREELFLDGTVPQQSAPPAGQQDATDFALGEAEWLDGPGT
ncbi:MAG: PBP1A family penicillin-binding protein [Deltaproteobacteria bacterium]|nr:PBP1A family penicillin-binding protein [Deltaproteobacteria bacterium]